MLKITGLHAHYGLSHVIQGVDLDVRPGEVVGVFGRNGVGKTTMMKLIAGWVKPSAGSISLFDKRIDGCTPDAICLAGVGFVPEDRRIFPGLSVEENLELGLMQTRGRTRSADREAIANIYSRFPRLFERRKHLGTTLSGGEQQMLAMARVIVGAPKLVLIDEPSEGLAPMIVAEVFGLIRELKAQGAMILLVEQNVREALAVSDRFYAVERGQIVLAGSAQDEASVQQLMAAISV